MKTIGILGGTGWVSTAAYYSLLNQIVNKRTNGQHFARCIIYSVNFTELMELKTNPAAMVKYLKNIADKLALAGAECLLLGANTLHMYASELTPIINIPLIHIAQATAEAVKTAGMNKVGLLGTRLTMEKNFYKAILKGNGIEAIIPEEEDRAFIDHSILQDFFYETFKDETRQQYLTIIEKLRSRGAEGIILGCTEIPLLLQQQHTDILLFNTTEIHANAAVDFALS